jgi:hypothetical protein
MLSIYQSHSPTLLQDLNGEALSLQYRYHLRHDLQRAF